MACHASVGIRSGWTAFFAAAVIVPFSLAFAASYSVEEVPDPKRGGASGWISDPDGVIGSEYTAKISAAIDSLFASTSAQLAVVALPAIAGSDVGQFATDLFNRWGIGDRERDDGVLVLAVMESRDWVIRTGDGLRSVLSDKTCKSIGETELVPWFKKADYGEGFLATVNAISAVLRNPQSASKYRASVSGGRSFKSAVAGTVAAAVYGLAALIMSLIGAGASVMGGGGDPYARYQRLRPFSHSGLMIAFPLPYLLVGLMIRGQMQACRDAPRASKVNGKPMRKLSESEDDYYLVAGQVTEEQVKSVDYDVWVTDNRDDVLVLSYPSFSSKYARCPQCGFKAYFLLHKRTLRPATYSAAGEGERVHKCKNCSHINRERFTIPRKEHSSSSKSWGGGHSSGGGARGKW